jgi:hypothetical protein
MTRSIRWFILLLVVTVTLPAAAFENPKALPPKARPQRRSGGESLPPLPLPATPLRRTEKKRQPAPPALVGMIELGGQRMELVDGERRQVEAFPTTQIDIERLMKVANQKLNIRYRYVPTSLDKFSFDPTELPLLYLTGWTPMPKLDDELVAKLRRYLYDGGTIVMHAQCGRKEFTDSARREIARILPDRQLAALDTDSYLLRCSYDVTDGMRVRQDDGPFKKIPPYLEAVYLGCRPAIVLSPIDLNCGWDVVNNPIEGGTLYHQDDATQLGVNLITATLANFQYARAWGVEKVFHEQEGKTRDELVIAQMVHSGDWDPTPHALPTLMKYVQANTTVNVQFKRETVDPADVDLFKHPVLYLTGLRDFKFTDAQVKRLRTYFASGGVLIADAAAGNKAFDVAFRREIARVLGEDKLKALPLDSPLYAMHYKVRQVSYSDLVAAEHPDLKAPTLEGISVDNQLAVIYSPLGLSTGWEQLGFAYNRGYSDEDSLRLGVNILVYTMTH